MSGIPSFSLYYLVQVGADNNRRTGVRATHEQQQHAAQRSHTPAGKLCWLTRDAHMLASPRALLDGTMLASYSSCCTAGVPAHSSTGRISAGNERGKEEFMPRSSNSSRSLRLRLYSRTSRFFE